MSKKDYPFPVTQISWLRPVRYRVPTNHHRSPKTSLSINYSEIFNRQQEQHSFRSHLHIVEYFWGVYTKSTDGSTSLAVHFYRSNRRHIGLKAGV